MSWAANCAEAERMRMLLDERTHRYVARVLPEVVTTSGIAPTGKRIDAWLPLLLPPVNLVVYLWRGQTVARTCFSSAG